MLNFKWSNERIFEDFIVNLFRKIEHFLLLWFCSYLIGNGSIFYSHFEIKTNHLKNTSVGIVQRRVKCECHYLFIEYLITCTLPLITTRHKSIMRTPEQHSAISDGCFKKERTFFELQVHLHLYMMYFDCIYPYIYTNTQWIGLIHIIIVLVGNSKQTHALNCCHWRT